MARYGAYRAVFAINFRSDEYDVETDQAPPLDEQFELLDSRVLNPDNDFARNVFNDSTFRHVVLATYPNPVGMPYGDQYYPPFGVADSNWLQFQRCVGWGASSGALGIEPDEAREVINFFMPEVNGRVRAVDNDGAGGRIHIVGHNGRGGIDDIPDFHDKGAMSASPDRLFSGVPGCTSFPPDAEDDPTTMYWFHPNRHGYDRLYVDERSRITSYFDRPYTSSRFSIQVQQLSTYRSNIPVSLLPLRRTGRGVSTLTWLSKTSADSAVCRSIWAWSSTSMVKQSGFPSMI